MSMTERDPITGVEKGHAASVAPSEAAITTPSPSEFGDAMIKHMG